MSQRRLNKTEKRFLEQLVTRKLLEQGDRLLVGVSGGPDSTALVHLLEAVQPVTGISIELAHCNFQLRGVESDEDERFVVDMASRMGFPLHCRRFDTLRDAAAWKTSIEETARIERYRYFDEICRDTGCNRIATGHHVDDNAETILFNLFRGTSVAGLKGIRSRHGSIIRPMLLMRRSEVMEYLRQTGIAYRTDSSNLGTGPDRNFIRHRVIPLVEERFGSKLLPALERMSRNAAELEEFLERHFEDLLERQPGLRLRDNRLSVADLLSLTVFERKEVLKRALRDLSCEVSSDMLDMLCRLLDIHPGKRVRVSGKLEAIWQGGELIFRALPEHSGK